MRISFPPSGRRQTLQPTIKQLRQYSKVIPLKLQIGLAKYNSCSWALLMNCHSDFKKYFKIAWQVGVMFMHMHSGERVICFLADYKKLLICTKKNIRLEKNGSGMQGKDLLNIYFWFLITTQFCISTIMTSLSKTMKKQETQCVYLLSVEKVQETLLSFHTASKVRDVPNSNAFQPTQTHRGLY